MLPVTLPMVTAQHDLLDVISDVDSGLVAFEDIWVSCYKTDEPSVHGKVRVSLDDTERSTIRLDAREGVEMRRGTKVRLRSVVCAFRKMANTRKG
jgi:proteasomal ATPase-associated factor 1